MIIALKNYFNYSTDIERRDNCCDYKRKRNYEKIDKIFRENH